ncbi:MAG TPA: peptide-methionine (S)-S-oxide reductase MsrA [Thermoanaerobaculia bacterium]|nr:peptide-methionine (S)-S-oxide reductase MsrA [Thermoanaerobaculia bacterium]
MTAPLLLVLSGIESVARGASSASGARQRSAAGSAGAAQSGPSGDKSPGRRGAASTTAGRVLANATFAGGCFWCMQHPFDELAGVISTTAGYTGGQKDNPTYEEVSAGGTGHRESVEVVYDPAVVPYSKLLDVFWHNIDPTDNRGQFCDKGSQYRSAIFYHDEVQRKMAEESRQALVKSGRFKEPLVTDILPAARFWPAEGYHQKYYEKNPVRYRFYRYNCGRDNRLESLWGAPPS